MQFRRLLCGNYTRAAQKDINSINVVTISTNIPSTKAEL